MINEESYGTIASHHEAARVIRPSGYTQSTAKTSDGNKLRIGHKRSAEDARNDRGRGGWQKAKASRRKSFRFSLPPIVFFWHVYLVRARQAHIVVAYTSRIGLYVFHVTVTVSMALRRRARRNLRLWTFDPCDSAMPRCDFRTSTRL